MCLKLSALTNSILTNRLTCDCSGKILFQRNSKNIVILSSGTDLQDSVNTGLMYHGGNSIAGVLAYQWAPVQANATATVLEVTYNYKTH